jgi:hypothetical protein
VLARARTAEASVTQNASDRKDLEARVKKAEADSRAEVEAATAARAKAESECNSLRDLVQSSRDAWARETAGLRDEVKRVQMQIREEREAASNKYEEALTLLRERRYVAPCLVTTVTDISAETKNVAALVEEVQTKSREAIEAYGAEVQALRADSERSAQEAAEARNIARCVGTSSF